MLVTYYTNIFFSTLPVTTLPADPNSFHLLKSGFFEKDSAWIEFITSLLNMHYMLWGYSFKLRPNSHAPGTVGSVITNGLLIIRYSHSIKLFDEKNQDWLVQNFRLQQLQRLDTTQAESPFLLFSQEEHIRRVCSQGGQLSVGVCMNGST